MTPTRLRRLKRDRERQTIRWTNFETRVKSVTDSPERGFELALYALITDDKAQAHAALEWAQAHPCKRQQIAVIRNWLDQDSREVACPEPEKTDVADLRTAKGWPLYRAVERLIEAGDKPEPNLAIRLLLRLHPDEVEHPDEGTHLAALALVSADPNGSATQFLQGWAIEDRYMIREGPGVGHELLWADPYLPGVGYQNLDPWLLDDKTGELWARSNWSPEACWISISTIRLDQQNCPPGWQQQPTQFGHMQLKPADPKCTDMQVPPGGTVILSGLPAHKQMRFQMGTEKPQRSEVSPTGLWRIPVGASGKACVSR